ncbi:MAG: RNA polymerase sigma factor [Oscillospiraceae bacterium]|nr:RNA polymerase sigma factor [Oscillospiraceae bacterium]MBR3973764.1 RNA polymerase sigma factor [Oscillospiraceae bacterium]
MDADILEELYRKYYAGAVLYCLALCGEEHLAQDLASDAFVKAYLSLPNSVPSFRYWLLRVCKNLWIDHLRKRKWETSGEPLEHMSDGSTPESKYLQDEQKRCLWQCLSELSPQDRELVTLHYISGLGLQEAARLLGCSYAAARQRMVRLRHTLKFRMEDLGYGELE